MSWQDQLKGDSLSWLLEHENASTHYLALRDLTGCPLDDPELHAARAAAHARGPIKDILDAMDPSGFWVAPGPGYNPKYRSTIWSVILLAQLGARVEQDSRIDHACAYLLNHALTPGGHFTMTGAPSGTVDCLQGNLCWALLELGCTDSRLETAFDWMARTVTGEGVAPLAEKGAARRYYAGKCGPGFACGANNKLPCAWGAVKVMLAFSQLPLARRTALIQGAIAKGVDFLLGVDPAKAAYPTGWTDKPSGNWWKFGFPVFYITDLLQNVDALARLGFAGDPRLANAIELILEKQDQDGRWALDFDYTGKTWVDFGKKKQPNKWVTLRVLRALKTIAAA
jgi:hypothetical protein